MAIVHARSAPGRLAALSECSELQLGELQFPDALERLHHRCAGVVGSACCRLLTGDDESLEVPFMDGVLRKNSICTL